MFERMRQQVGGLLQPAAPGLPRQVWRWIDDRTGASKSLGPMLFHPVPGEIADTKAGWYYVFGTTTLFAFMLQVITGIGLAASYVPAAADAYDSLQFITHDAPLGSILRGMHYFGASAMVIVVGLHMTRVFLTGSYKFPREVNWLSGLVLLLLTLVMAFTGQLLRWDQDGVWSVVIAAEQAGRVPFIGGALGHLVLAGRVVGAATLSRFFAIHVFFVPGLLFAFIGFHLYLVLHHGISEPPKARERVEPNEYRAHYESLLKQTGRPYFPNAFWREAVAAFAMIAIVAILAIVVGPKELGKPPDPSDIVATPRPDWYFLSFFAFLALTPARLESYVIVYAPLLVGIILVLLPFIARRGERSPARRPWAVGLVVIGWVALVAFFFAGREAPWAPHFGTQPLTPQMVGADVGPPVEGARLFYAEGCQYCHRVEGQGGVRGPDLTHVLQRLSEREVASRILEGSPGNMPAYARTNITPQEVNSISAFLAAVNAR